MEFNSPPIQPEIIEVDMTTPSIVLRHAAKVKRGQPVVGQTVEINGISYAGSPEGATVQVVEISRVRLELPA